MSKALLILLLAYITLSIARVQAAMSNGFFYFKIWAKYFATTKQVSILSPLMVIKGLHSPYPIIPSLVIIFMITFSGWVNIAKEILKGSFSGIGDLNISTH